MERRILGSVLIAAGIAGSGLVGAAVEHFHPIVDFSLSADQGCGDCGMQDHHILLDRPLDELTIEFPVSQHPNAVVIFCGPNCHHLTEAIESIFISKSGEATQDPLELVSPCPNPTSGSEFSPVHLQIDPDDNVHFFAPQQERNRSLYQV